MTNTTSTSGQDEFDGVTLIRSGIIMAGYDGSTSAKKALLWAAQEAELRKSELRVVHSWEYPTLPYGAYPSEGEDLEASAQEMLDAGVTFITEKFPNLKVTSQLTEGHPVVNLIKLSKSCDMLVVGSRGHGGFSTLVLGSVSSQLAHHCQLPLMIIHSEKR